MKERLTISLKTNLALSGAFTLCFLMIRLYTGISISDRLTPEIGSVSALHMRGTMEDIGVAISISLLVTIISLLITLASKKAARISSCVLFFISLLLGFAINQFFVVTLTPLSADLFGYSLSDVKTTVGSSGSTLGGSLMICILIVLVFVVISVRILRTETAQRISTNATFAGLVVMIALFFFPWRIQAENYENDLSYYVAANKLRFLTNRTIELATEQSSAPGFSKDTYPLLRKVDYTDSLGSYFNKTREYPNLVFIIVEGLGRDFCGSNAPYGGFTPFIDSLARQGLYWENALSNAGRTFGAPPSILGSLPYAKLGIMGYGNAMPNHHTLISLLKPFGYNSNFFYGGNPNFDNLDLFLERQKVDFFLNESNFPTQKKKAFWGYNDADLFEAALQKIEKGRGHRLDVFLTINTHEPFVCPDSSIATIADKKINAFHDSAKKEIMQGNKNVFECLLYTDYAIRKLMEGYAKRADYDKTIFVITGDHRLIPVPQDNKIKRYHVPILIYSKLLKEPKTFSALTTHSAILPSFLSFLHHQYALIFPEELPIISSALPMRKDFSSELDIALIRNKNEVKDYVSGHQFLSEDRLYTILPDLKLKIETNDQEKRKLKDKLKSFQAASIYAFENNLLDKVSESNQATLFSFTSLEENYLESENIRKLPPDDLFVRAKELAVSKDFEKSRAILKNVLNQSPNYHDARILLARTYAWQSKYDTAQLYLVQTLQRSPNYADCYVALSDIEYWQGQTKNSLDTVEKGLKGNPTDAELLSRKARALVALNKGQEAKMIVIDLTKKGIDNEIISQLKKQLK